MSQELILETKGDTIEFMLTAEAPVTNRTVRMTCSISTIVAGRKEEDVRNDIHEALARLVKGAEWNFHNIRRTTHAGDEVVTLKAVARVEETENRDLENRARAQSKRGLHVTTPEIEYSFPLTDVEESRSDLRIKLLEKAHAECGKINAKLVKIGDQSGQYRIKTFVAAEDMAEDLMRRSPKGMSSSSYSLANTISAVTGTDHLQATSKLVMNAVVVLERSSK